MEVAAVAQGLHFVDEAGCQHGVEAFGDARVQPGTVGGFQAEQGAGGDGIVVVGGLPGALTGKAAHKDIALARDQVEDGIAELLDYARTARSGGLPLAIEPLHPMYAADRACINTLEQALDLCDALDPSGKSGQPAALGVAVDVYHVWWDPKLQQQIERAGASRLHAFHVCDWLTPTTDLLNDRGMMGDGVIDIPKIRSWVEQQGFGGYSEVEIFSVNNWWQRTTEEILATCIARHREAV